MGLLDVAFLLALALCGILAIIIVLMVLAGFLLAGGMLYLMGSSDEPSPGTSCEVSTMNMAPRPSTVLETQRLRIEPRDLCPAQRTNRVSRKRRQPRIEPFPWARLPMELRLMVLDEYVAQRPKRSGRPYANLATVCKEWQEFFEKITFHLIRLDLSSLDEFKSITEHRQHLVHHIQFCARPDMNRICGFPYELRLETRDDKPETAIHKFVMVKEQIRKLLAILKTWPATKEMVLELTADRYSLTLAKEFDWRRTGHSLRRDINFVFLPKNKDGSKFSLEPRGDVRIRKADMNELKQSSWTNGVPTYPQPPFPDEVLDWMKNGWRRNDPSYELFPQVSAVTFLVLYEPFFLCHGTLLLEPLVEKFPRLKQVISGGPRRDAVPGWWLYGRTGLWYINEVDQGKLI